MARWHPKHLCASVVKAAEHLGQVSWLKERLRSHHSGATARELHPLPYSLRLRSTQMQNYKELFDDARDTITHIS
jgi:hypothetical protein